VIALNSNCRHVGGCGFGSPQEQWLRDDLTVHKGQCILAYWHHALFSSGLHGSNRAYLPFWRDLYSAGADLVLVGHDHDYEAFAPQDEDGHFDPRRGIRELVVGTGGKKITASGGSCPCASIGTRTARSRTQRYLGYCAWISTGTVTSGVLKRKRQANSATPEPDSAIQQSASEGTLLSLRLRVVTLSRLSFT